ncbi:MAG: hypothetical protein WB421_20140, partial [Terriglobales bacterium]
ALSRHRQNATGYSSCSKEIAGVIIDISALLALAELYQPVSRSQGGNRCRGKQLLPPRPENSQPSLKLDQLWSHLPQAVRQTVIQALTRVILEAASAESEVADD